MASNREGTDQIIAQFVPPVKGVWQTIAAHQLPQDALRDALNICIRAGATRPRPGLAAHVSDALADTPTGAIDYISAAGVRNLLVGANTKLFSQDGTSWDDVTGGVVWVGDSDHPVRFTLIEFGTPGVVYAVACNGVDSPIQYDSTTGVFTAIAGTPPIFSDVCTAFDRIVGLIPPYEIRWGEALSLSTWPASNARFLSDTPDPVVGIRNLGTMGVAAYKQKAIFMGQPQGGPSSSAFAFQPRAIGIDGPASAAAIVDADGIHYYLSPTGRIGCFDGMRHKWVADGLWPKTRTNVDAQYMGRSFGVYNPNFHEIYFFYPGSGSAGVAAHGVILSLPYPEAGIGDFAAFPFAIQSLLPMAGTVARTSANVDRAVVLDSSVLKAYAFDESTKTDGGLAFSGYIQTGLVAAPDIEPAAANVEPFVERGEGYGSVTYQILHSDILDVAGGTGGDSFTLDLTDTPARDLKGYTVRGRFFGLKLSFTMPVTLGYYGAALSARSLGRGPMTNPN